LIGSFKLDNSVSAAIRSALPSIDEFELWLSVEDSEEALEEGDADGTGDADGETGAGDAVEGETKLSGSQSQSWAA